MDLIILFCKDVANPTDGRAIFECLMRHFPTERWKFFTDDGFWEEHDIDEALSDENFELPPERAIEMEEWLETEWRSTDELSIAGCVSEGGGLDLRVTIPPQGGGRLCPRGPRVTLFHPETGEVISEERGRRYHMWMGLLELRILTSVHSVEEIDSVKAVLAELFQTVEGSWGIVGDQRRLKPGWIYPNEGLGGIGWLTAFGPDLAELMGSARFQNLPIEKTEWLEDGSALLTLTPTAEERYTLAGWWKAWNVKRRLGRRWFRDSRRAKRGRLILRNLIVDES